MLSAVFALTLLALTFGLLLGFASVQFRVEGDPLADRLDAVLPQTQCGQCGFPGCRPYAEAMARGEADFNRCPPGGQAGIEALAAVLGVEPKPLDPENGVEQAAMIAIVDETVCIGCTLCLQACPVDAILGSAKHMHTVISQECTGCGLCVAPCPVDCITLQPVPATLATWKWPSPLISANAQQEPARAAA